MDDAEVSPWCWVLYQKERIDEAMTSLCDWAKTIFDEANRQPWPNPEDGEPTPWDRANLKTGQALRTVAQTIKAPGFRAEDEARVFVTFNMNGRHIEYRATDYGVVRYVKLTKEVTPGQKIVFSPSNDDREKWRLPIRSVRLGPLLDPDLASGATQMLLRGRDYKRDQVTIVPSKVQLR